MTRIAALVVLMLVLAGQGAAVAAAATCPKTSLGDVENEVMCNVCGVPLALATEAPQANRERAFISREIAACKSKQQIKDELVAQFGTRVLALPPDKGFNLVAYLAPAAALLAGIAGVVAVARRRRRRQGSATPTMAGPALPREDAARLDADLQRYDV